MAYSINHNTTVNTGSPDITISIYSCDPSDYAVTESGSGKNRDTKLTNLNVSDLSSQEQTTLQFTRVPNIYLNSEVEKTLQAPTKTGLKIYHNLEQVWTYSDGSAPTAPVYNKPVRASLMLSIPNDGIVTTNDVTALLKDLLETFYWDGVSRLDKELRGATNPLLD